MITGEYYEQPMPKKLVSLDKLDKFLDIYEFPDLTREEI